MLRENYRNNITIPHMQIIMRKYYLKHLFE